MRRKCRKVEVRWKEDVAGRLHRQHRQGRVRVRMQDGAGREGTSNGGTSPTGKPRKPYTQVEVATPLQTPQEGPTFPFTGSFVPVELMA